MTIEQILDLVDQETGSCMNDWHGLNKPRATVHAKWTAMLMMYEEGYKLKTIAYMFGTSESHISSSLANAKAHLEKKEKPAFRTLYLACIKRMADADWEAEGGFDNWLLNRKLSLMLGTEVVKCA